MTKPDPRNAFADKSTQTPDRPSLTDLLLLLATVLFGLSVGAGVSSALAVAGATVALGISIGLSKRDQASGDPPPQALDLRILLAVALFGILGLIGWAPSAIGPTSAVVEHLPGAIFLVLAASAFLTRQSSSTLRFGALTVASLLTVSAFGIAHIHATGDLGFDVYHLHVAAADAISNRENPWTDVVQVSDGSPNADPGDVISGYVYPPITAVAYALGHWLTPDNRYTSLLAWLAVLSIIGIRAVKKGSNRNLYTMMLLAAVPGLWLVLRAAWTEPLSLMFAAVGVVFWGQRGGSGLGIGTMLASKQYFFVTGPVLLLHRDRGWMRRLFFAAVVVVVMIAPALLWDPAAFWDSAVAFHTSTETRSDSMNLVGLLALAGVVWAPPTLLPLGLGLGAAIWAGLGSTTQRGFMTATAFALAASFLVSSQAFSNYWLMVFGLCALALAGGSSSRLGDLA